MKIEQALLVAAEWGATVKLLPHNSEAHTALVTLAAEVRRLREREESGVVAVAFVYWPGRTGKTERDFAAFRQSDAYKATLAALEVRDET